MSHVTSSFSSYSAFPCYYEYPIIDLLQLQCSAYCLVLYLYFHSLFLHILITEKMELFFLKKKLQRNTLAFSVVSILLKSVFISISHFLPLSHLDKKNMNNELYASVKMTLSPALYSWFLDFLNL